MPDRRRQEQLARQARSFATLRRVTGRAAGAEFDAMLGQQIRTWLDEVGLDLGLDASEFALAGAYLAEELGTHRPRFVSSAGADELRRLLFATLDERSARSAFEDDVRALADDLPQRLGLLRAWLAVVGGQALEAPVVLEAATRLIIEPTLDVEVSQARVEVTIEGLLGRHPRVQNGALTLRYDRFVGRLERFRQETVPGFRAYRAARHAFIADQRRRLPLSELTPRVLSSFVGNKLINDVYLPLVGDNLAKQMGAVGGAKRTDLMGLLLLISPPGYGKTTLMEYVAQRLGLVFVKVNGPSLGHDVHSLDPAEAPNATSRQEVEKINLAFEMGNNVMLYLDDIQHTHPELLQKFISLCDGHE